MSKQLIYLVEDHELLGSFSGLRSHIVFGHENLNQRLHRQLTKLKKKYSLEIVKIKQDQMGDDDQTQIFDTSLVFFDYISYSDSLVEYLIDNRFFYNSNSLNTIAGQSNHTISSETDVHGRLHFPYDHEDGLKVSNRKIFAVPLRLPIGIYPDKSYEVVLTEFFYQPLTVPKDILKIQSCIARESTAQTIAKLSDILNSRLLKKIINNSFLARFSNRVGKNCKIHSTAVLESCVIGDNVEIGPHCYLRAVVVGDNVTIREGSSIKVAVIGQGSYIVPSDIFNCFIGENCNVVTHILYHTVVGANTFIGGGVGFADFKFNAEPIFADDQIFFGAVVGENCFVGAGLLFQAGIEIPRHTKLINYNQISYSQFKPNQIYVAKGAQVTHIPKIFFEPKQEAGESTTMKVQP